MGGGGIDVGGALVLIGGDHTGGRVRMDGGGIDGGGSTCAEETAPTIDAGGAVIVLLIA